MKHHFSNHLIPRRVVLLGSRGFIAGRFKAFLEKKAASFISFSSEMLDLTKPESVSILSQALQPEDVVIMFSALTPDKGKDLKTFFANMKMGEHVIASIEKNPPAHFIYISTDAVYSPCESPLDESSPCETTDLYGLAHLNREKLFQTLFKTLQRPLAILRPCAVYGVGDTHLSYGPNRFIQTALKDGKITLFGQGEEIRHHIWIEDLLEWIWSIVLHRSEGLVNLVSGQGISFGKIAQLIVKASESPIEIVNQPRQGPITHKVFRDSKTRETFPQNRAHELELGIASLLKQNQLFLKNL